MSDIYRVTETVGDETEQVYFGSDRQAAREAYHYRAPETVRLEVIKDAGTDDFDDDTTEEKAP